LNDSLSSSSDVGSQAKGGVSELCDQLGELTLRLQSDGLSAPVTEALQLAFKNACALLATDDSGFLYAKYSLQVLQSQDDYSASATNLAPVVHCLSSYLASSGSSERQGMQTSEVSPCSLLISGFNELLALGVLSQNNQLASQIVFVAPRDQAVELADLNQCTSTVNAADGPESERSHLYLEFSQQMLDVLRGVNRSERCQQLEQFFVLLADEAKNQSAIAYWRVCAAYFSHLADQSSKNLSLSAATVVVLKQIEKVVMAVIGDSQTMVLGLQDTVDGLLSNLLYLLAEESFSQNTRHLETDFKFGLAIKALDLSIDSRRDHPWLKASAVRLHEVVENIRTWFSDAKPESMAENLPNLIAQLKQCEVWVSLLGVSGSRENLAEIERYLEQPLSQEGLDSCLLSIRLVEEQLVYHYALNSSESRSGELDSSEVDHDESRPSIVAPQDNSGQKLSHVEETSPTQLSNSIPGIKPDDSESFGVICNAYIDVIQQALDIALGSSGNLSPDDTVINSLNDLIAIVKDRGIDSLNALLNPLLRLMTEAEENHSTLNQSDTLLVQEAIVATTLGIDALVTQNAMPDLISDVSARIDSVLSEGKHRLKFGGGQAGSYQEFINETEELLPRLFELFQRWRSAPTGSSRLLFQINRLLHALKVHAEQVGEGDIASLAHYLESTLVDIRQRESTPSEAFYDLAVESIEALYDDTERLRNKEERIDHSDLIDRLKLTGGSEALAHPATQSAVASSDDATQVAEAMPREVDPVDAKSILDWSARLATLDRSIDALSATQEQLIEKQQQLVIETQKVLQEPSNDASKTHLNELLDDLALITRKQSRAISRVQGNVRGRDPQTSQLNSLLRQIVAEAATAESKPVQFKFESSIASDFDSAALAQPLTSLLTSMVLHSIESASRRAEIGKPTTATIGVWLKQSDDKITVKVSDDGAGVTAARALTDNPWHKLKASHQVTNNKSAYPQLIGNESGTALECEQLFLLVENSRGSVKLDSNDHGTTLFFRIPQLTVRLDILLVEVNGQCLGLPASAVVEVGVSPGSSVPALSQTIGIKSPKAFQKASPAHRVKCKGKRGYIEFSVDKVIGRETVEVFKSRDLLPDLPGYIGASTGDFSPSYRQENVKQDAEINMYKATVESVLLILDLDYWFS